MENNVHKEIIRILENKGPSLPIQLAKEIRTNSLFISAFLSELTDEKTIKVSHLKVGGSPLYLLPGQEQLLEKYQKYLHPREAEALLLLKEKKVLKDSEQTPTTRVALRSIRDFAIGFKKQDEIFWRYAFASESEIIQILKPKKEKPIIKTKSKEKPKNTLEKSKEKITETFQNPLIIKTKTKKKEKSKSDFVLKVIHILNSNYKIIEEKSYKAKEYNCIIQISSNLGPINFLTQAKDKKTISETDLKKLLSNSQSIPLPALMLHTGKLSKKAEQYSEKYSSILKIKRI